MSHVKSKGMNERSISVTNSTISRMILERLPEFLAHKSGGISDCDCSTLGDDLLSSVGTFYPSPTGTLVIRG